MCGMRVGVVGAGIMGCTAARAIARDGHDVVLYEQFEFGHDRGSSHGRTRIVRLAYPEREWVRLAAESFDGWRELEDESGVRLLELYGLVEFADERANGSHDALTALGASFEPLTERQVRGRWPLAAPPGWTALFQERAGIVRADLALRAFVDSAVRHGARLLDGTRVASVDDVDADVVVVTAGSWVRTFVADLPVRTTRETVAYFRRDGAPLPSLVQLDPTVPGAAMYSLWDPKHGLKVGAHHAGSPCEPDDDGGPDQELVDHIGAWVAATHLDADPTPVATQTCRYTTTSDERFVLRRDGRTVIGSACSGHGFKFAPTVGRRLADLVAGG